MTENATVRTVEHGEASDLPEISWGWRRGYTYALTMGVLLFAWRMSERVTDVGTLRMSLRYAFGIIALLALLYLAGASTEAIARLLAAVRTTRKETLTSAPPPATIQTPEAAVSTPPASADDPAMFGGPRP